MALAKPVSGGCSCSRSATCGCDTGTPQAKHFDDGSVICVPYEHCSLIFVCRYRNCQSNPCLQVLMGAGSQIHAEGNSLFLESVVLLLVVVCAGLTYMGCQGSCWGGWPCWHPDKVGRTCTGGIQAGNMS